MIRKNVVEKKSQIISEYLSGTDTLNTLELKHGIKARTIQSWVRAYRKKHMLIEVPESATDENIKGLKKQLEHAQLKNELLEEMLRLSEEQTGIDFRKKFGTRQS
jgi:transposase-like protein